MKLSDAIEKIKLELGTYYSIHEIWVFIYEIFRVLLNFDKAQIHVNLQLELSSALWQKIRSILRELKTYKPIQYILKQTFFYGLYFKLTPDVLIPRPETEELVNVIIEENKSLEKIKIIDIGTGSGCIAISLAKFLPNSQVYATDLSSKALEIAKLNSKLNQVNVQFQLHDIIATYPLLFNKNIEKFDIIVSNPPYVLPSQRQQMSRMVLDYEPEQALFVPEKEPLIFYEAICYFAQNNLKLGGKVYCEINDIMVSKKIKMLHKRNIQSYSIYHDLNGKSRIIRLDM